MAFAPDQKTFISVGEEGAIFVWKTPEEVQHARAEAEVPIIGKQQTTGVDYSPSKEKSRR